MNTLPSSYYSLIISDMDEKIMQIPIKTVNLLSEHLLSLNFQA